MIQVLPGDEKRHMFANAWCKKKPRAGHAIIMHHTASKSEWVLDFAWVTNQCMDSAWCQVGNLSIILSLTLYSEQYALKLSTWITPLTEATRTFVTSHLWTAIHSGIWYWHTFWHICHLWCMEICLPGIATIWLPRRLQCTGTNVHI